MWIIVGLVCMIDQGCSLVPPIPFATEQECRRLVQEIREDFKDRQDRWEATMCVPDTVRKAEGRQS